MAIPMQFNPIAEAAFDVIQSERALHVPRDLHTLPGRQVIVNFAPRGRDLRLHRFHLGIEIDFMFVGMFPDFLKSALQFEDRLFKIERVRFHR